MIFIVDQRKRRPVESTKIGTLCPAQMAVHIERDKVSVQCYLSHYGHDVSLDHIRVPKLELETIKGKILDGVRLERIISVSSVQGQLGD